MDIVRDVLDESVVDRNGREMGRVDGVDVVLEPGRAPRIEAILIGPVVLGSRLHPALGRLVSALERRLGLDRQRPVRIAVSDIDEIGPRIRLRLTIGETAAAAIEEWFRVWVLKVPGSR